MERTGRALRRDPGGMSVGRGDPSDEAVVEVTDEAVVEVTDEAVAKVTDGAERERTVDAGV
jgi:hypothetical protein